jgi:hypothetical protein
MASGPAPRSGMGCVMAIAIGFGAIALLAVATCGGAAYWALSPGDQSEPARLVGEESLGYVEVGDLASSPAVGELLEGVLEELDRRSPQSETTPEWLRSLQSARRDYRSILGYVIPRAFVLTFEPAAEQVDWMSAVNFSGLTRPAKLLLTRFVESGADGSGPLGDVLPYGDSTLYEIPEGASFAFLGGTFVAAAGPDWARKAVDRLSQTGRPRAPLRDLETPRPGSWDARGVFSGPALLKLGIAPELAKLARLGLRMDDADTATGYLVVDCVGEAEAANLEQALSQRLAASSGELSEEGLEIEFEVVRQASAVDVDLRLAGLGDYLVRKLEPESEEGAEMPEEDLAPEEAPLDEEEAPGEEAPSTSAESPLG